MAPEQSEQPGAVDHRADIYALGVVFYQMLTGELPGKRLEAPSRKVKIDVRLDAVVLRALEKKPELRYQQAGDVKTMIETIVNTAPPESPLETPVRTGGSPSCEQPNTPLRFSRMAIWAALWVLVLPAGLVINTFATLYNAELPRHDVMRYVIGLPGIALIVLGMLGVFGTTILGWISVSQIRRSAGKLCGLGLAVFDGLLFPLLLLNGLFVRVVTGLVRIFVGLYSNFSNLNKPEVHLSFTTRLANLFSQHPELAPLIAVLLAIIVDFFIIRAVWRAVNKPTTEAGETWQSPTMGWGHFIGYLQGITFTAPLAYKLANLSALGFLSFLGFMPLPGWKGFFGFSGFSGLIGLSTLVEMVARSKARRSGSKNQQPPRTVNFGRWQGVLLLFGLILLSVAALVVILRQVISPQNPDAIQQTSGTQATAFGPVIELVLPFSRSCIDFQTGTILRPDLEKRPPMNPEEWDAWIKRTGADAMVEEKSHLPSINPDGFPRLVALQSQSGQESCAFVGDATADFESVRPNDAEAKLKPSTSGKLSWTLAYGRFPWWFKTRDGAKGVLQILGVSDNPRGLKIRYKLLVSDPTASQSRSRFPKVAHICRDHHSVLAVHDGVDLDYVFYYAGEFTVSSSSSHNERTGGWRDRGRITIGDGRTFDFHRESDDPSHVHINSYDADLSTGRVIWLRDDIIPPAGMGFSVPLRVALDPPALAKLIANPGLGQLAMRDANLSFAPAIEREVNDEEAIEFDSGKQMTLPEIESADKGFGGIGERVAAGATWMEQHGMDALFGGSSLNAFGMKVRALKNETWDEMGPSELGMVIVCIDPKARPQVLLAPGKDGPGTYAFQTRERGRGILQVLSLTNDGVKIRYKLIQEGTGKAPTAAKRTTLETTPAFGPVTESGQLQNRNSKGGRG